MRAAALLALVLVLVPGCATTTTSCELRAEPTAGGTSFCVATSDGWSLQGVRWNDNGTRGAVVLVHGLNEDHHSYDALAQELAARGWRVVAFDSRGMGLSTGKGDFRNFTQADFAAMDRDLDAVVGSVGGRAAALVGASVGSSEALRYAARADKALPLVLLSPGLGYQGIEVEPSNRQLAGPALFEASSGDAYATNSVSILAPQHPGPHGERILDGALHGTQILQLADERAFVEGWLDANATRP